MRRRPSISVVIPTRERADTLASSLRSCTSQDDDELEIIVSDNFSADGTRDIVASVTDERVRYFNTGRRLGMSQNWEFGLSQAAGDYVMFLGDDDALLPGATRELRSLIVDTQAPAVSWRAAQYCWPDHTAQSLRNRLVIPIGTSRRNRGAATVLRDVLGFRRDYLDLPSVYHGLVSRTAIDGARDGSGRFFCSRTPDVYSGIAIACVIDTYVYCSRPYSLNGASSHSTGTAQMTGMLEQGPAQQYISEDNIPFHPRMTIAGSIPILVAECFMQARDHIASAERYSLDLRLALETALDRTAAAPARQHDEVTAAVADTARKNGLAAQFETRAAHPRNRPGETLKPISGLNIFRGQIQVDCLKFGVNDVADAALLSSWILTMHQEGVLSVRKALGGAATRVASRVRSRMPRRGA